MLPLLLAAALAEPPADLPSRVSAAQPARAVVRIVRGTAIRFQERPRFDDSVTRETMVRERDGSLRRASLIEFY